MDRNRRQIGLLAGKPRGAGWEQNAHEAAALLEQAASKLVFAEEEVSHRRGVFRVLTSGIFYGMGRRRPGNRKQEAANVETMEVLRTSAPIVRIAGYQSREFSF